MSMEVVFSRNVTPVGVADFEISSCGRAGCRLIVRDAAVQFEK
jgi:hypothetical protein